MGTKPLQTKELAEQLGTSAESIRVALCRRGSFYGVVPKKTPSGRLLWPSDAVERVLAAPAREYKHDQRGRFAAKGVA